MLTEFLVVGGWLFWAALLAVVVFEIAYLTVRDDDNDEGVFGTVVVVAALIGTILFTDAFRGVSLWWLIPGMLVYVVVGVLWSFKKWYDFVLKEYDRLRAIYGNKTAHSDNVPIKQTWTEYAQANRTKAISKKGLITTWMTLWPFSFSWWVLTWPRRLFEELWRYLVTTFDRISDGIFNREREGNG